MNDEPIVIKVTPSTCLNIVLFVILWTLLVSSTTFAITMLFSPPKTAEVNLTTQEYAPPVQVAEPIKSVTRRIKP